MKRTLALLLALVMIVIAIAACGKKTEDPAAPPTATPGGNAPAESTPPPQPPAKPETPEDEREYGGVLRIVCTAEGASPIGVPWEMFGVDSTLWVPVLETLILEKISGEHVPHLAESWEEDPENLEIRLKIREGVYFTDGSEMTAEVAAWNLLEAKAANSISSAILDCIAVDKYNLLVKLETYSNNIMQTFAVSGMISKEYYEKNGHDAAADNPVGTGPFMMKDYVRGSHLMFEKNPNYWQEGKPYLDGLGYMFIRDAMTQVAAMQASGDQSIDILNTTSGEQISQLRAMGMTVNSSLIGPISLVPSSRDENSPFAKLEVRQAIAYAIDRQALCDARGFGVLTPAPQWIDKFWPDAHLDASYEVSYDLDKAKALMIAAGYPDGFKTTLFAQPALADKDAVVAMQDMLAKIGIIAEVEFPDGGGYSSYRSAGWDGLLVQHTRSLTPIYTTFNFYFGVTQNLLTRLYYPDNMEQLIQDATNLPDNFDTIQEMAKIVADEQLIIPCYNLYDSWITKPNVIGGQFGEWGRPFLPWDISVSTK